MGAPAASVLPVADLEFDRGLLWRDLGRPRRGRPYKLFTGCQGCRIGFLFPDDRDLAFSLVPAETAAIARV